MAKNQPIQAKKAASPGGSSPGQHPAAASPASSSHTATSTVASTNPTLTPKQSKALLKQFMVFNTQMGFFLLCNEGRSHDPPTVPCSSPGGPRPVP
jgi:hypothetical protein